MGVSFSAGTSPAVGKPSFEIDEHQMELGLGIHGEPGVKRTQLQTADELTETLLAEILKHGKFGDEKRVAVMVNNLGASTRDGARDRGPPCYALSRKQGDHGGADVCRNISFIT